MNQPIQLDNTVATQKQLVESYSEALATSNQESPDAVLDVKVTLTTTIMRASHTDAMVLVTKLKTWLTTLDDATPAAITVAVQNSDVIGESVVRTAQGNVLKRVQEGKIKNLIPPMPGAEEQSEPAESAAEG